MNFGKSTKCWDKISFHKVNAIFSSFCFDILFRRRISLCREMNSALLVLKIYLPRIWKKFVPSPSLSLLHCLIRIISSSTEENLQNGKPKVNSACRGDMCRGDKCPRDKCPRDKSFRSMHVNVVLCKFQISFITLDQESTKKRNKDIQFTY